MKSKSTKKILVAPLNWGLGHATRCIPIINALLLNGFTPVLASDGAALDLLRKEFPELRWIALPSYDIRYAKNARLKWQLIKGAPRLFRQVRLERKKVATLVEVENFCGIISDNRLGVHHPSVPSVYITHQLKVLSGSTTRLTSWLHRWYIDKFDECWVPDHESHTYSGSLSIHKSTAKYLGVLSRLTKVPQPVLYDFLILLSGPEPQRTLLEQRMVKAFSATSKRVLLIRGVLDETTEAPASFGLEIKNYALTAELERLINASEVIIARSGYSTILDLAKLQKKAFLIPTPGQYEQAYLARRLNDLGIAPFANQDEFTVQSLQVLQNFSGFITEEKTHIDSNLFKLFERK